MIGKKAQSQAMSIVIITGIVIGLVSIAYLWGKPLIEKRSTVAEFSSIESFILELDKKIISIANSGSGSATINIPFGQVGVKGFDEIDSINNTFIFQHSIPQPIVLGAIIPIKTSNLQDVATYGEAQPRIITLEVQPLDDAFILDMKMKYRELDKNTYPRKGFLIALNPVSLSSGKQSVTVSFGGTEIITNGADNGGDLVKTNINVELV